MRKIHQVAAAAANVFGNKIWFPRGAYMTCGGQFLNTPYNFPVPAGVTFTGMGFGATTLRQCASDPSGSHYISLCDSYMSTGEFGCASDCSQGDPHSLGKSEVSRRRS